MDKCRVELSLSKSTYNLQKKKDYTVGVAAGLETAKLSGSTVGCLSGYRSGWLLKGRL